MDGLQTEYGDRVNFVRLDYDKADDSALAQRLGVRSHPAYAFIAAGEASKVEQRAFGPLAEPALRERLDALLGVRR